LPFRSCPVCAGWWSAQFDRAAGKRTFRDNLIPQWFEQSTQEFFTATAGQDGDPPRGENAIGEKMDVVNCLG